MMKTVFKTEFTFTFRFYLKQTPEKPKHTHLLYEPGYVMPYVGNFMAKIARVRMFPFPTGV
jgi:hypothetical protein